MMGLMLGKLPAPKLDRRAFLMASLGALAVRPLPAWAAYAPDIRLLNRLTFGATPALRADLARLGAAGWLEAQLALPAENPDLAARLTAARLRIEYDADSDGPGRNWPAMNELRPLSALSADPASLLPLLDWDSAMAYPERARPGNEVIAASLIRAVHAPAQLREVMTQFWHDHFNVFAQKNEFVSVFFPGFDSGLRAHALGNFRAMLGHVATAPALLIYLTNDESRASPATENFARELLELHTLGAANYRNGAGGAPPGPDGLAASYSDEDVYEVARAFTGWTVGDGRETAEGATTPETGRFAYVDGWHDPYQKRILGRAFASHQAPMADGNAVLDMLATHPGTARFVCTKIARRLLADDPPEDLIDRLATVFLAHSSAPDQIAEVIRALVADPAFDAPPTKMRRPFEWLVAILRTTGAEVAATDLGWTHQLARAGWMQHAFPPPTGHPDRAEDWSSGIVLLRMVDMALYAQQDWMGIAGTPPGARVPPGLSTVGAMADHWGNLMTGQPLDLSFAPKEGLDPSWDAPTDADGLNEVSTLLIAAAALSPQFLYR